MTTATFRQLFHTTADEEQFLNILDQLVHSGTAPEEAFIEARIFAEARSLDVDVLIAIWMGRLEN